MRNEGGELVHEWRAIPRGGPPSLSNRFQLIVLLMFWTFVVCFQRLGEAPVYIDNEAREGVCVRAMLASGDYVLPHVPYHLENGLPIPDKPPLFK